MGKIYFKIVALVVFLILSFGFLAPFMVSQKDDIMVIGGFAYLVGVVPPVAWMSIKNIIKNIKDFAVSEAKARVSDVKGAINDVKNFIKE